MRAELDDPVQPDYVAALEKKQAELKLAIVEIKQRLYGRMLAARANYEQSKQPETRDRYAKALGEMLAFSLRGTVPEDDKALEVSA